MSHRFYCADLQQTTTTLDDSESHHALHVLRLQPGAAVTLFDGCGQSATGIIARTTRRSVVVEITQPVQQLPLQQSQLTVAAAVPKGDRVKFMVEKLAEIGVDRWIPLQTQRSVTDPRQTRLEKLKATVIAAAKQSERDRLMIIDEPATLTSVLQDAATACSCVWIAHPDHHSDAARTPAPDHPRLLLIGPEGGFTEAEVQQALQGGATALAWPDGILRVETAAVVFAALLLSDSATSRPQTPAAQ